MDKSSKKTVWIEDHDSIGQMLFTVNGSKVYNLFRDYPWELTP